jgi:hypothetical protein
LRFFRINGNRLKHFSNKKEKRKVELEKERKKRNGCLSECVWYFGINTFMEENN